MVRYDAEILNKLLALLIRLQTTRWAWRKRSMSRAMLGDGERGKPDLLQERAGNNSGDEGKGGHDEANSAAKTQQILRCHESILRLLRSTKP
jgi:hypothetical protein